jgi:hypothetical protein
MLCNATGLVGCPEVSQLLAGLLNKAQAVLGEHFVGMYLYGSLAIGGFDLRTSDIDFLVVTSVHLSRDAVAALSAMHARLLARGSHWAQELEGSYIPQSDIRRHDPQHAPHPHLERGSRELVPDQSDDDWVIHRRVLREQGVVLAGPETAGLIDPVSPAELRRALQDLMRCWWTPMIADPARLLDLGYRSYAIQTMCRMLYTLKFDTIVPKPVAAQWVKSELDARWAPLIDWSFQWPQAEQPGTLEQTCELIRLVSEHCMRLVM